MDPVIRCIVESLVRSTDRSGGSIAEGRLRGHGGLSASRRRHDSSLALGDRTRQDRRWERRRHKNSVSSPSPCNLAECEAACIWTVDSRCPR